MALVFLSYVILSGLNLLAAVILVLKVIIPKPDSMKEELKQEGSTKLEEGGQTSRLSYKRQDLTIEIPNNESMSEDNMFKYLFNFYKENMFPICLASYQNPQTKLKILSNWFLVLYFEASVSLFLLNSEEIRKKSDYVLLISTTSLISGLFISVITSFFFELGKNPRSRNLNYIYIFIKSALFITAWVLGLLTHIYISTHAISDYVKCLSIIFIFEVSVAELTRTSIKFSLLHHK